MFVGAIKTSPASPLLTRQADWPGQKKHDFVPSSQWRKPIFTDKKRLCLDEPNGTECFSAGKCLPREFFPAASVGVGE